MVKIIFIQNYLFLSVINKLIWWKFLNHWPSWGPGLWPRTSIGWRIQTCNFCSFQSLFGTLHNATETDTVINSGIQIINREIEMYMKHTSHCCHGHQPEPNHHTGIQTDNEMQEPQSGVMTSCQGGNPSESLQTFNPKNDL